MEKKVSIVLPVYNAEKYLKRCLDSILNQDYSNIELITIDDGSKDSSWSILSEYQKQYPQNIKLVKQENMGVSKTRNKGISLATGEYLTFIDNDDFLDKNYISYFVSEIDNQNLDVVIGGYKRPNSKGKIVEKVQLKDLEYSKYKIVAAWGKIYRTSYIKENKIEFLDSNIGEDINFTIQAVSLTKKIKITDYVGYNWFFNESSVSNTAHKSLKNNLQFDYLLNSIYDKLKKSNIEINDIIEFYFIKLNVWFMLYSTRHTPYKLVEQTLEENMRWLKERFPNFSNNKYLGIGKMPGETITYQFIIWFFIKMIDFRIIKLFLRIYSTI